MDILKLRTLTIIIAFIGLVMFGAGWATNHMSEEDIKTEFHEQMKKYGEIVPMHSSDLQKDPHNADDHLIQAEHQVNNRPWASLLMAAMLFFGLSAAVLFFFSIQNAAQAGWSIVVLRIMQSIASYLPFGAVILGIVVVAAAFHLGHNHLYHWMEDGLGDKYMIKAADGTVKYFKTYVEGSVVNPEYDFLTDAKSPYLNIPFWLIRIAIYFLGCTFFYYKLKAVSNKLDVEKSYAEQRSLYNWSVGYIAFFALASAAWAWDFLMSIDHHWYSTLFIWYTMVSCLVSGVAFILIFSIYMKKQGKLQYFNDNHQHDLTKYLFGFSLLWSYLWFDQFMLQWYANIPEEVIYFLGRYKLYPNSYFWMLIPNLLMPLIILISSSIKRKPNVVLFMCCVILFGHMWDFYNIVMPGTVGGFHNVGLLSIGAYLLVGGIFGAVVLTTLSKTNMVPEGNAYLHESEIYEYPF